MSAFQVSPDHINALLRAAYRYVGPYHLYHDGKNPHNLRDEGEAQRVGHILWDQNARSVQARYGNDEGTAAGPFTWSCYTSYHKTPTPVETLKLCACYAYQACETEDWDQTEAYKIIEGIEQAAINALPGYDAAPWEWIDPKLPERLIQRDHLSRPVRIL